MRFQIWSGIVRCNIWIHDGGLFVITIDNILYCTEGDNRIYQEALKFNKRCYFLEFKLVPNCNIHASYKNDEEPNKGANLFVNKTAVGA